MKRGIRLLAFLIIFLVLYYFVDATLKLKSEDGIGTMKKFYSLPADTVDVLMVGSSHIGMNIDPSILWEEYGIASYSLWSGMQPVWNTYYFLKEGLKTQMPKLVVLETFMTAQAIDYSDYSAAVKSTISMKWSLDKIRATYASFEDWGKATEVLWGMAAYHERYDELIEDDFNAYFWNKDTTIQSLDFENDNTYPFEPLDYNAITQVDKLTKKNETYLRKIIDLCKVRRIPLLLITLPFQATREEYMRYNHVKEISQETGIEYLDFFRMSDQVGLDYQTDFRDIGHLNGNGGIQKVTRFFGSFMKQHYDIPDHRQDDRHIWNKQQKMNKIAPLYSLKEQFIGNGINSFVDTGLKLYENIYGSWTLLASLNTRTYGDDEVFFSCFSEDPAKGNYGLLVKKKKSGALSIRLGDNIEFEARDYGEIIRMSIVKQSTRYTVYLNGKAIITNQELPCAAYDGTLLIGCQELPGKERFRFSRTITHNLEVFNAVLDSAAVVAWNPSLPPAPALPMGFDSDKVECIFHMDEQFVGDGLEKYIDTGIRLYEDPLSSFTMLARLKVNEIEGDGVYFSCFSEDEADYRGLMLRQNGNTQLDIIYGENWCAHIVCRVGEIMDIVVRKRRDTYDVYFNGLKIVDSQSILCAPFKGNLLIGCQETFEGKIFRNSTTWVQYMEVFSGCLSEESILSWAPETPDFPEKKPATSVAYQLPSPFLGDGTERFIDTGIILYDQADKDWTMTIEFKPRLSEESDVFVSCFDEEEGEYRGLLIRGENADSMTVLLGNQYAVRIPVSADVDRVVIVIVKQEYAYSMYVNGEVILKDTQSPCRSYQGHLLIGCQEDARGNKFRFSDVAIEAMKLIDRAMAEEEAIAESRLSKEYRRFD